MIVPDALPLGHALNNSNQTAAGTTQATATKLDAFTTVVTTVPPGSGVRLDPMMLEFQDVVNASANLLLVYPPSGIAIGIMPANTPYQVAAGEAVRFIVVSLTQAHALASSTSMQSLALLPTTLPSVPGRLWLDGKSMSVS